jgi:hypothetical protein
MSDNSLINSFSDLIEFLAFSFSLLILFAILFYIYKNSITSKINKVKSSYKNSLECKRILSKDRNRLFTDYFWYDFNTFVYLNVIFALIFAIVLVLDNVISSAIGFLITTLYIYFIIWTKEKYQKFPDIAKERLESFENSIKEALKKELSVYGQDIEYFSSFDKIKDLNKSIVIFETPTSVSKIKFPPFGKSKNIIKTRKLTFLVVGEDFIIVCTNATEFNLLYPKRGDIKKKCAEIKSLGGCEEYLLQNICDFEIQGKILIAKSCLGEDKEIFTGGKLKDMVRLLRIRLKNIPKDYSKVFSTILSQEKNREEKQNS